MSVHARPLIGVLREGGVAHTVQVTAATLYEAVALGLAAIGGNERVMGVAQGLNTVNVRVTDIPVDHEVRLADFTKWLERRGGSPRETSDRNRIKELLSANRPTRS